MIKVDNGYYYMTCGDVCYVAKNADGALRHVCFGKRVEVEDDLAALGISDTAEFGINSGIGDLEKFDKKTDMVQNAVLDVDARKAVKTHFKILRAEVVQKQPLEKLPTLRGDGTLAVTLAEASVGLEATLYYTPYSRGAIARRMTVKNVGTKKLRFNLPPVETIIHGEYYGPLVNDGPLHAALAEDSDGKTAYGAVLMFGGEAMIAIDGDESSSRIVSMSGDTVLLAPGEEYDTPEVLMAYSENGDDGVARIIHDVLREYACPERFNGVRRPITVFGRGAEDAKLAAELGAEAFVTDVDLCGGALDEEAEECRKNGLKFGLRVAFSVGESSELYKENEKLFELERAEKTACLNLSKPQAAELCTAELSRIIEKYGAEYVVLPDVGMIEDSKRAFSMYAILGALNKKFPELIIEAPADFGCLCYAPICTMTDELSDNSLFPKFAAAEHITFGKKPSLKTRFDLASLGCLSYELGGNKVDDALKNALRAQVFSYQDDAALVMSGDIYRHVDESGNSVIAVSKDKSKAYGIYISKQEKSSMKFKGLDAHNLYYVREIDKVISGATLIGYGIAVPSDLETGETVTFHLRQVADYE